MERELTSELLIAPMKAYFQVLAEIVEANKNDPDELARIRDHMDRDQTEQHAMRMYVENMRAYAQAITGFNTRLAAIIAAKTQ